MDTPTSFNCFKRLNVYRVLYQRGAITVLTAIAMLLLLGIMGLAFDTGHIMISKTRLQNAVDASVMAAAKHLDETGNTDLATSEARHAFSINAASSGNQELADAYQNGSGSLTLAIDYSSTLPPFAANATTGPYVRVSATGYKVSTWLLHLLNFNGATLSATAVAGPRVLADINNAVPLMVCGDSSAGSANHWGYTLNEPVVLKSSDSSCGTGVGNGNFQLLALGGTGADQVRNNLAGGFEQTVSGSSTVLTEPGNLPSPVLQGLNTRFGSYTGSMSGLQAVYPPDVIVKGQPSPGLSVQCVSNKLQVKLQNTVITSSNIDLLYNFTKYTADLTNPNNYDYKPVTSGGIGAYDRRTLVVPVGDCSSTKDGRGSVPVLGFACFWLLQPITNGSSNSYIYGEFIRNCAATGWAGSGSGLTDGPHMIQLFKNPGSSDS